MVLFISPPFGNYITFLPGTVPISGSFTLEPRPGLLHQIMSTLRYNFEHGGWVNKIGLRNKGIHYGLNNFSANDVLSIAIKKDDDVAKLNDIIPRDRNIEINVSCPNTSIRVPKDLGVFVSEKRRWCIIKLSPLDTEKHIDGFYRQGFRQFHCCNTFPVIGGGLSGPYLIPYVKEKITYIKKKYPDTEVIAGGGVRSIETANAYRKLGADHISVSTLCFNPIMFGYFYSMYPDKSHALFPPLR